MLTWTRSLLCLAAAPALASACAGDEGGSANGDAVGEYIDDMGVCRTDDESFAADCPATPAVPTLCSMCATVRKKVCPELVEYEADCTLKRTCWYDKATSKLVGARYCDDSKIHCDNKSMCLNRGSTPLCQGNVDVCIGDAGTD